MKALTTILAGAIALSLLGGCDTSKSDGDKTEQSDKGDKKKKKKKKSQAKKGKKKGKRDLEGKKVAASDVANKGKLGTGADDDATGFQPKMRGAIAGGEETLAAKIIADPELEGDATDDDLSQFGTDFKGAFGSASEKVEPPPSGVIGAPSTDATMVWRYVEPLSKSDEVAVDVGRIVMLGGSQWQTTLLAVDPGSGSVLAAATPVLSLNAAGEVSETKGTHRFKMPLSQLGTHSGNVVFALASSKGDGVHNALGIATGSVSGGTLSGRLQPDSTGYLSGRKYVRRGTTSQGAQVVTQLHFVMFLADNGCLALQVHEMAAPQGGAPQKMRFGGCAKVAGSTMSYEVNVMCLAKGNQEQCKRLGGKRLSYPLQLFADGLKWNGIYHLVPLEGGSQPQPQRDPEPKPEPEPKPDGDDPDEPSEPKPDTPKPSGKQKSYSDREVQ